MCGKFIDEALKQQKEEIMEMIEKLELSLTTEPDKPKRGRPRKYPQVRVKRVYPYNDAYNQALFDIKSKLSDR